MYSLQQQSRYLEYPPPIPSGCHLRIATGAMEYVTVIGCNGARSYGLVEGKTAKTRMEINVISEVDIGRPALMKEIPFMKAIDEILDNF